MKIGKRNVQSGSDRYQTKKWYRKVIVLLVVMIFSMLIPHKANAAPFIQWEKDIMYDKLPPTPEEAVGSKVNLNDTFSFPGVWGVPATNLLANNAWQTYDRDNVVVMYDGNFSAQKSMFWYKMPLNLDKKFEFEYYIYLSSQRNIDPVYGVGDGFSFVIQNDPAATTAIGKAGGAMGVYPDAPNQPNMIYNALTLEFDTYENGANRTPNYDKEFANEAVKWPHVAIAGTKPTTNYNFNNQSINEVYDNFKHLSPTFPTSRRDADENWFGRWVPVSVKWEPLADGINAKMTYNFNNLGEKSEIINIDEQFNKVNGTPDSTNWTKTPNGYRKAIWGFTGSNSLYKNAFAVMVTKLPQQPEVEINRTVRNVSKQETTGKKVTSANIGDYLEYEVTVDNKVTPDSDLSLFFSKISEDMEGNSYVKDSFEFVSDVEPKSTKPKLEDPTTNGNKFSFVDSLDGTNPLHEYKPGTGFTYRYRVQVGTDSTEVRTNVTYESRYSNEFTTGETVVNVEPEELSMVKTAATDTPANDLPMVNPIVGQEVTYKLEINVAKGRFMAESITDSLAPGMELVANSTFVYNKGENGPHTPLNDAEVWNGNNLSISKSGTERFKINGGSKENNILVVEYRAKPNDTVKGEEVVSPIANASGTNDFQAAEYKKDYSVATKSVTIKVKTDLTIHFNDDQDAALPKEWIDSKNLDFKNQNPVILYYNTDDPYDVTEEINNISESIFTNHILTQTKVTGELKSSAIAKSGAVVTITYSAKSSLIVEFVDEDGVTTLAPPSTFEGNVKDKIDVWNDPGVQKKIKEIEAKHYVLTTDGRPANDTAIEIIPNGLTVIYVFKGTLYLSSAPDVLDFDIHEVTGKIEDKRIEKPKVIGNPLVVTDTRSTKENWTLKVQVDKPLQNDDGSVVLPDAIKYKNAAGDVPLTTAGYEEIFKHKNTTNDFNVTEERWNNATDGFFIDLKAGDVKALGKYNAEITIKLEDAK